MKINFLIEPSLIRLVEIFLIALEMSVMNLYHQIDLQNIIGKCWAWHLNRRSWTNKSRG